MVSSFLLVEDLSDPFVEGNVPLSPQLISYGPGLSLPGI